jgi:hypothetical protein
MGIRIRQAPSGKVIEGTVTGQILIWNNVSREWDVAAAPSGGGFNRAWMSLVGIPEIDDGTNNGLMTAIGGAVAADFSLQAPGTWALGNLGQLTYTGPDIDAIVTSSATGWTTAGGGFSAVWCHAVSFNSDLIGTPILDGFNDIEAALRLAGANSLDAITGLGYVNLTTSRRLTIQTGDTIQPALGKNQAIGGIPFFLEGLAFSVIY